MLPTLSWGHETERCERGRWPGMGSEIHTKKLVKFPPQLICCKWTGSSCEQWECFPAQRGNKPDNVEGNTVQLTNHFVHVWVRDSSFWVPAQPLSLLKEKVQHCQSTETTLLHSSGVLHATREGNGPYSLPWTTRNRNHACGWKKGRCMLLHLPRKQPVFMALEKVTAVSKKLAFPTFSSCSDTQSTLVCSKISWKGRCDQQKVESTLQTSVFFLQ